MRRMSFALTTKQVLDKSKKVTRRLRWNNLRPGDCIQPIEKGMGLKKGEKQKLIGDPIKVVSISVQRLHQITPSDVVKEGFPEMTTEEFIEMFCRANKCDRNERVNRIEYEYLK